MYWLGISSTIRFTLDEHTSVCVCVCVCERERERERECALSPVNHRGLHQGWERERVCVCVLCVCFCVLYVCVLLWLPLVVLPTQSILDLWCKLVADRTLAHSPFIFILCRCMLSAVFTQCSLPHLFTVIFTGILQWIFCLHSCLLIINLVYILVL